MIPEAIGGPADRCTTRAKHHKTLLNIVKHNETHVKHSEPLVKHHETLKTLWDFTKQSSFDATISALDAEMSAFGAATSAIARRSCDATISAHDAETSSLDEETSALGAATTAIARSYRRYRRGVSGGIGDCGVSITPQMCNRVTNHGDMSTFSKPA